jgi:hypothetical protein
MLLYEKTVPSGGKYMRSYTFLLDFSVSPDGGTFSSVSCSMSDLQSKRFDDECEEYGTMKFAASSASSFGIPTS